MKEYGYASMPPIEEMLASYLSVGEASMTAMVSTERHLWVNWADIGEKVKIFLLDAPVLPSEVFGTSVETVVRKFRGAKVHSAALKMFIPPCYRYTKGFGESKDEN